MVLRGPPRPRSPVRHLVATLLPLQFLHAAAVGVYELVVAVCLYELSHHHGHIGGQLIQGLPSLLTHILMTPPLHQHVHVTIGVDGPVEEPVHDETLHIM